MVKHTFSPGTSDDTAREELRQAYFDIIQGYVKCEKFHSPVKNPQRNCLFHGKMVLFCKRGKKKTCKALERHAVSTDVSGRVEVEQPGNKNASVRSGRLFARFVRNTYDA
jgi:hypothetical protein